MGGRSWITGTSRLGSDAARISGSKTPLFPVGIRAKASRVDQYRKPRFCTRPPHISAVGLRGEKALHPGKERGGEVDAYPTRPPRGQYSSNGIYFARDLRIIALFGYLNSARGGVNG